MAQMVLMALMALMPQMAQMAQMALMVLMPQMAQMAQNHLLPEGTGGFHLKELRVLKVLSQQKVPKLIRLMSHRQHKPS